MIEPNIFNFYVFGADMRPLRALAPNTKLRDNPDLIQAFLSATHVAEWFVLEDFCKTYLPSSGRKLGEIKNYLNRGFLHPPEGVIPHDVSEDDAKAIVEQVSEFETLLSDELSKLPFFCLEDAKIGNFSINKLLKGASDGYPNKVRIRLTQACKSEIDEAGKCLVYERSTAAGFHILRSVELTIRQYLMSISGFVMPPLNRQNWGEYLDLLKKNGAARVVTDHLHNIKDNYRNPLMHPEDSLELDEAVSLFAVAQSMSEMLVTDMLSRGLVK
ncbi:MAG TPA: hypothetical protein VK722_21930 [Candidatus Aquilonibacter sp.]|jgi:hypothetical protein|nr:hypothetical protein [Candidatus Aquilonibacter sp.]